MHDLGPEIRRAISGNLEDEEFPEVSLELEEPMHRVKEQPPDGAECWLAQFRWFRLLAEVCV